MRIEKHIGSNHHRSVRQRNTAVGALAAAAMAAVAAIPARAGSTTGQFTLSTSGSTALKNWFAKTDTFTDVEPGHQLNIAGVNYPSDAAIAASYWSSNSKFQVAPTNFVNPDLSTTEAQAVRVEYHESGSVEGVLEMVNDQVGIIPYVTTNIDRNPEGGNAVWVNRTQIGASGTTGGTAWSASGGASFNNQTLGNFYGTGVAWNGTQTPTFSSNPPYQVAANAGTATSNGGTGQDAVVLALSDAIPVQIFQGSSGSTSAKAWNATPNNSNYGQGNPSLPQVGLGVGGGTHQYQSTSLLNYPSGKFGTGLWNSAGLGNLNSQTVAYTATCFVANSGTGLVELNRTDAQWLQLTSRLSNGASFNMTTRDVNSGTRNVAALNTGIDPTWTAGLNDDGNGNSAQAVVGQISIGPNFRFSNKTAGGAQLRPTVQNARMSVGTLSINDANGNANQSTTDPVRALLYADAVSGYASPIQASYSSISDGTYAISQQEQFVTAKAVDGTYSTYTAGVTGGAPVISNILGDDSTHTVTNIINNTLNSVQADSSLTSAANPADGLLSQGYLLPQLMQVKWAQDGIGKNQSNLPADGGNYSATDYGNYVASGLGSKLTNSAPSAVGAGKKSIYGDKGDASVKGTYNGLVYITDATGGDGTSGDLTTGNALWGNFNQNGKRDYSAFKTAVVAAQSLYDQYGAGGVGLTGATANSAKVTGTATYPTPASLTGMQGQTGTAGASAPILSPGASKGDLIVLGDYNGDGRFDGKDLYSFAAGAALADSTSVDTLTSSTTMYQTGILRKNAALDYVQSATGDSTSASQFLRNSARPSFVVLTANPVPTYAGVSATDTGTAYINPATNTVTGELYTWDATGANAFNKADVNRDGMVNLDDAFIVDKFAGQSYNSLDNQMAATINADGTLKAGTQTSFNLVNATLVDYNSNDPSVNKIQQGDMNVVNTALAGTFNYAWYTITKPGPLNMTIAPAAGSHFSVPTGTSFKIAAGNVTVGGAVDPFTDTTDSTKSLNVTVGDAPATLEYTAQAGGAGTKTVHLGTVSVEDGSKLKLDAPAAVADRTILHTGALTFAGSGKIDITNNELITPGDENAAVSLITNNQVTTSSPLALGYNAVGGGNVEIRATLSGDSNLDGNVNVADLANLAGNFGATAGVFWLGGDFDYNGNVNVADLADLAGNFGQDLGGGAAAQSLALSAATLGAGAGGAAVPEPTTLGLLGVASAALLLPRGRRRRREHQA
jgi:hypothetical protein